MLDLQRYQEIAVKASSPTVEGRLCEIVGLVLEAQGCHASIGDVFELHPQGGQDHIEAEVVGLRGNRILLMPLGPIQGLEIGCPIRRVGKSSFVHVGDALLGRVVDGLGEPIDGKGNVLLDTPMRLHGHKTNPLNRQPVDKSFSVGVRSIDAMITMGQGQRMGIFAGGGVGKSSLLGMMVRHAEADVAVVALIGERGREVEEFVHRTLEEEGLAKSVVVAVTSADPPLVRVRGALYATTIAEYFRSKGKKVLLVMDSLTRFAMAMREIGLSIGEPPTTKGYTPTVFAALPSLLERAGNHAGKGSITGIYTVLVEGDDLSDPIADSARAILDGHIVLSRGLAEKGHFPAIDVLQSISRVMTAVAKPEHKKRAVQAREMLATYREAEDLISIGAYKEGVNAQLDEAVQRMPSLLNFLRQPLGSESTNFEQTIQSLVNVWGDAIA